MLDCNVQNIIQPIVLGKIGSCYGIHGWIKMFSFTETPENIFNYNPWFVQKINKWYKIQLENWQRYRQFFIVKLQNINDRNVANFFVNCEINISYSQLPKLENGFYYWKDLIDCQVINIKGCNLGRVINIIETKSNDVLVVKPNYKCSSSAKRELLIPFIDKQIINEVDFINKIIRINWNVNF